jgi:selenocysteine lyase/cysteine desulfurase
MPEPALAEFNRMQAEFETHGVASTGEAHHTTEATRQRVAAMLGATSDEIAFTRNATDGINLVLAGIDWQPGDEVITTSEEHEAMMHPLLYLQKSKGIRFQRVEVSEQAAAMLPSLERAVSDRTRLVAMSLVTCESGARLPAREISQWAAEHNLLSLFDGAQSSGAYPVKVKEIGCDYYASNGHKWLSGPKGTGFFYGRSDKLACLSPAHVGAGSLEHADVASGGADLWTSALRFEFGTRAWGLTAGLCASLDWFESLGWENVYAHIAGLAGYLKECILARPYLRLITPLQSEASAGLTSFVVEGRTASEVSQALREQWRIYVRVIPHYNAIRISTAHFNNPGDVEKLMEALDSLQAS